MAATNPAGRVAVRIDADDLIDAIARRVADLLDDRPTPQPTPWLTVDEAAERLRCDRQRLYDLVHAHKLVPARDGRRLLFAADALDSYLRGVETRNAPGDDRGAPDALLTADGAAANGSSEP